MTKYFAIAAAGSIILGVATLVGSQTASSHPVFTAASGQATAGSTAGSSHAAKGPASVRFAAEGNNSNWLQGGGG